MSGGVKVVRAQRASVTWRWVPQRVTAIRLWPERQGDAGRDVPLPGLVQGTPVAVAEPQSPLCGAGTAPALALFRSGHAVRNQRPPIRTLTAV